MPSPESSPASPTPSPAPEGALLYQPPSWFAPLDLQDMFGAARPLEVELGSGDGSFLVAWAARHPERNYLGIERLLGRIRKLDRKGRRAGITHLRGLRIEASYALQYLLPQGSVDVLHVYFPDPWPKRRHHRNRLINETFLTLAHRVLGAEGTIHLRTDSTEYFTLMTTVFPGSALFREVPTPEALALVVTDFEREFLARGIPTHRASYRKVEGIAPTVDNASHTMASTHPTTASPSVPSSEG